MLTQGLQAQGRERGHLNSHYRGDILWHSHPLVLDSASRDFEDRQCLCSHCHDMAHLQHEFWDLC